ncbi:MULTISPECIES: hypothetical protein [Pseudomonas]|uniref:hypothetical protein n=1 Tax=Pseudomonas TaxID=286 RepID=UPI0023646983|nr:MULTISPECIES: hypothetical protein [Pseudomonas]MDD2018152.1 hypothetical protein [Pseudomonas putida]HDS1770654.1 hypothetical protein [Pseudomonas putida]
MDTNKMREGAVMNFEALKKGLVVTESGNGKQCIRISFESLGELHAAHDQLLQIIRGEDSLVAEVEMPATYRFEGHDYCDAESVRDLIEAQGLKVAGHD